MELTEDNEEYALGTLGGWDNTPDVSISFEQYNRIKRSVLVIRSLFKIENLFGSLNYCYLEWEKLLLTSALDHMTKPIGKDRIEIINRRITFMVSINNFLSAVRMYFDHTAKHLDVEGLKNSLISYKNICKSKYNSEFEYKFIQELRNYSQHEDAPFHIMSSNMDRHEDRSSENPVSVKFGSSVYLDPRILLQDKKIYNKIGSELQAMNHLIDLSREIRLFMNHAHDVHGEIIKVSKSEADRSINCLERNTNTYWSSSGDNLNIDREIIAFSGPGGGEATEIVQFNQILWSDVIMMRRRLRKFNFQKAFVSSELNKPQKLRDDYFF